MLTNHPVPQQLWDECLSLLQRAITIQEEERRLTARNLYDRMSQYLIVLTMEIEAMNSSMSDSDSALSSDLSFNAERLLQLQETVKVLSHEMQQLAIEHKINI